MRYTQPTVSMEARVTRKLLVAGMCLAALGTGVMAQGSRLDEFGRKLRLNEKEQRPKLDPIFQTASRDSQAAASEMIQARLTMLNAELQGQAPAVEQARAAYKTAATKVAVVEAKVLTDVYALLQPRQQERAGEAFEYMAGFFQAAAGGGRGGGRRGGQ